jgi:hypothetical protein
VKFNEKLRCPDIISLKVLSEASRTTAVFSPSPPSSISSCLIHIPIYMPVSKKIERARKKALIRAKP